MPLRLNQLRPAAGARTAPTRVGRGIGSGLGKTAGRGHKGSFARKGGGKIKAGFEGGQTPMYRRLPKIGFRSRTARFSSEIFTYQLNSLSVDVVDAQVLRKLSLVPSHSKKIKVVLKGAITKAILLKDVLVTAGAKAAIEAAGGRVEE